MRRLLAALIICLCLTGCMGFWFDRDQGLESDLENQGMPKSRAEQVVDRGKQYTERLPFPWNLLAGLGLGGLAIGAKVISDKRSRKK